MLCQRNAEKERKMIIDSMNNCKQYYALHKNFQKAFEAIENALNADLPVGKYEIDGKDLYISVQEYATKAEENARFEAHRKYIDIQYIVSGEECVEVVDLSKTESATPYNEEKDVEFYMANGRVWRGVLTAGEYGIFMPNDVHRPAMSVDGETKPVKKILVKIKL